MGDIKKIHEELLEIEWIRKAGEMGIDSYRVGDYCNGVDKIVPYLENGEHAPITFIAVYRREQIIARLPANGLHIIYVEKQPPEQKD